MIQTTLTWHRVEETVPDDNTTVLVAAQDGIVEAGQYDSQADAWLDEFDIPLPQRITHWADFPTHPTKGDK
jgi:hypothetical protein